METKGEIIVNDEAAQLLDKVRRTPEESVAITMADLIEPRELEQFLEESGIRKSPAALEILGASRLARQAPTSELLHRARADYERLLRKQQLAHRRWSVATTALTVGLAVTALAMTLTNAISAAIWVILGLAALMGISAGVVHNPSRRSKEKVASRLALKDINNQLTALFAAYEEDRNLDTAISRLEQVIAEAETAVRK